MVPYHEAATSGGLTLMRRTPRRRTFRCHSFKWCIFVLRYIYTACVRCRMIVNPRSGIPGMRSAPSAGEVFQRFGEPTFPRLVYKRLMTRVITSSVLVTCRTVPINGVYVVPPACLSVSCVARTVLTNVVVACWTTHASNRWSWWWNFFMLMAIYCLLVSPFPDAISFL